MIPRVSPLKSMWWYAAVQAQINVISVTASQTCGNKTNKHVRNPILLTFGFYSKKVYRQADIQPHYLHSLGELSIRNLFTDKVSSLAWDISLQIKTSVRNLTSTAMTMNCIWVTCSWLWADEERSHETCMQRSTSWPGIRSMQTLIVPARWGHPGIEKSGR